MREFEKACIALRDGDISFDEFFRRSKPYWLDKARKLMRRRQLPVAIDIEDVLQDLSVAAWKFALNYDSNNKAGASFKRYIVWNAIDKANKEINIQRNSYERTNTGPSRFPTSISTMSESEDSDWIDSLMGEETDMVEEKLDVIERIDIAICRSHEQDPSSAFALAALKLNRLDIDKTLKSIEMHGAANNPTQAYQSLELATETYL